jgi:Tfp pilus assembly protein PilV
MKFFFTKVSKLNHRHRGFTLLETLIAISIFTTSVLAMMSVLSKGIAQTNYAKTKMVASYLAQEGVEYMKNMRDTYVLYDATSSQNGWNGLANSFIKKINDAGCQGANGCYFNDSTLNWTNNTQPMKDLTITSCSGTCLALSYNATTGKYSYTGTPTSYVRKISVISPFGSSDAAKVTSTVTWTQGSGNYSITFSDVFYNWIE